MIGNLLLGGIPAAWIAGSLQSEFSSTTATINSYMIDLINNHLLEYGSKLSNQLIGTACALGAIFAICVAAAQAYKVMVRGEEFNVLSVMRPLIFAFVLSIWPSVCSTLMMPGRYVEKFMRSQYVYAAIEMDNRHEYRKDLALDVQYIINEKNEAATDAKENSEGILSQIQNLGTQIKDWFTDLATVGMIKLMHTAEWILMGIGEIVFMVNVYIVFLIKVLYLTVLMMFGPIYMVCSILDVWKDSWSQWVGRMVSVSFYGAMAYLVMTFSCELITFTINTDIIKLNEIIRNPDMGLGEYLKAGFGTTIMVVVGYLTGAIAMGTVNELASFVFPGSHLMGASSFIGGMKNYAMKYSGTKKLFAS